MQLNAIGRGSNTHLYSCNILTHYSKAGGGGGGGGGFGGLSLPDSRFGTCGTYDLWIRGYIHLHKINALH